MRNTFLWLLLMAFALLLIIMGFQGSLGRVIAVVLTPASLEVAT